MSELDNYYYESILELAEGFKERSDGFDDSALDYLDEGDTNEALNARIRGLVWWAAAEDVLALVRELQGAEDAEEFLGVERDSEEEEEPEQLPETDQAPKVEDPLIDWEPFDNMTLLSEEEIIKRFSWVYRTESDQKIVGLKPLSETPDAEVPLGSNVSLFESLLWEVKKQLTEGGLSLNLIHLIDKFYRDQNPLTRRILRKIALAFQYPVPDEGPDSAEVVADFQESAPEYLTENAEPVKEEAEEPAEKWFDNPLNKEYFTFERKTQELQILAAQNKDITAKLYELKAFYDGVGDESKKNLKQAISRLEGFGLIEPGYFTDGVIDFEKCDAPFACSCNALTGCQSRAVNKEGLSGEEAREYWAEYKKRYKAGSPLGFHWDKGDPSSSAEVDPALTKLVPNPETQEKIDKAVEDAPLSTNHESAYSKILGLLQDVNRALDVNGFVTRPKSQPPEPKEPESKEEKLEKLKNVSENTPESSDLPLDETDTKNEYSWDSDFLTP